MPKKISIRGARVHNLKNLDLDLPRNELITITGVSGSGKSSLAFDTLYAEGQRRYVESLSAYARQFLERMDRPEVDEIKGISPAVAIEQKNPVTNSRSTVATATEVHDYLRLLFARIGQTVCPDCNQIVKKDTVDDVVKLIRRTATDVRLLITFPLRRMEERSLEMQLVDCHAAGFKRALVDESVVSFDRLRPEEIKQREEVLVIVDRLQWQGTLDKKDQPRVIDSIEQAFEHGHGYATLIAQTPDQRQYRRDFSQQLECSSCRRRFIELQPRLFSFNNPFGACETCKGFGDVIEIDMDLVVPDKSKSIADGAIVPWSNPSHWEWQDWLFEVAGRQRIRTTIPFRELNERELGIVMEGEPAGDFPGIRGFFKRLEKKRYKIGVRVYLSRYRGFVKCPDCRRSRLRPEALNVFIDLRSGEGKTIADICRMTIGQAYRFFRNLRLTRFEHGIAHQILQEIRNRLGYLVSAGLEYLTLERRTQTLSGGESQRINLATIIGAKLVGALYILDEPTIGLHPRDNRRLIRTLRMLQQIGNTVVIVEHDREMMEASDFLVDMGPRAGRAGGEVVFAGALSDLLQDGKSSLTAAYLKEQKSIAVPPSRRTSKLALQIKGASENNLKKIDVSFPLHVLTAITGVSGSGKSSLVHDVLYTALMRHFDKWPKKVGKHDGIAGQAALDDVVLVDQSPIGRTPRSNPVTYIKASDDIRKLFANTLTAKVRNYLPGMFSFNTPGGRCPECEGAGAVKVEMQFLADIYLPCDHCDGKRFTREVLEVNYHGKTIVEVLDMTVDQAVAFFEQYGSKDRLAAKAARGLSLLQDVGLGYLRLGQPATTLSGGEAQRVKLAAHLAQKEGKHLLYLFDEPTTGLHFDDIATLLDCFDRLLESGNSVIVIEHNLEVIKCADWIIDLGPEGGEGGGRVIAEGTPEQVADHPDSWTGKYLKKVL